MADSNQALEVLEGLPLHPAPSVDVGAHRLEVVGAVGVPATYSATELRELAERVVAENFECLEGWVVEDLEWRGVLLGTLFEAAQPSEEARWATLGSGDFTITLPLDVARASLVALDLGGAPLEVAHGGPMRLLVPEGACYTSIKWLDRIELTSEPLDATARGVAIERIGRDPDA